MPARLFYGRHLFWRTGRMFVKVAIPIPSAKTFTYAVPETFVPAVALGKRVLVPFGRKRLTGWIIEIAVRDDARSDDQGNHRPARSRTPLRPAGPCLLRMDFPLLYSPPGKGPGRDPSRRNRREERPLAPAGRRPGHRGDPPSPPDKRRSWTAWHPFPKGSPLAVCAGWWGKIIFTAICISSKHRGS